MSKDLSEALRQLASSRDVLLSEVHKLDAEIEEKRKARHEVMSGSVSATDFAAFLRADIKRRGAPHGRHLGRSIAGAAKDYGTRKRIAEGGGKVISELLVSNHSPVVITEEAVYFYFGDLIADRIVSLIENDPWPSGGVPCAERAKLVASLDADIDKLSRERDALAGQLVDAGMAR